MVEVDASKICASCDQELCFSCFHKCARNKDGMSRICKSCKRIADRADHLKHREKRLEAFKRRAAADPIAHRARAKAWYDANKDKAKSTRAAYREANREKLRANAATARLKPEVAREIAVKARKWAKENPVKRARMGADRRAAKMNATPLWANKGEIEEIYAAARRLTNETGVPHHVDHIVPLKSRLVCGFHVQGNLQVLPARENMKKHNSFWPDMP